MHHTSPDSSALSILRCYCARRGSFGSLLCFFRHLLPFPHKTLAGRRRRLSKHFEQPCMRGTELGNDGSRLAGYVMRTKYGVFGAKCFVHRRSSKRFYFVLRATC